MKVFYDPYDGGLGELERKLQLLADGEELELTAAEAAIYGVDFADEWLEEDDLEGESYE